MLIGGIFNCKINGTLVSAKGDFTYNFGSLKKEGILGSDGKVTGFKVSGVVPFIEGQITDTRDLNVKELQALTEGEITLELVNGKVFVLSGAEWSSDGNVETAEGAIAVRFEGVDGDEFLA